MTNNYKKILFSTYCSTHVQYVDSNEESKLPWFLTYVSKNYLPLLSNSAKNEQRVLDIGCNRGYLLAALRSLGFQRLHGIDLSPGDIEKAREIVPSAELTVTDAFDYLDDHKDEFDVIFLKAILEHVDKNDILSLLEKIRDGLRNGGKAIIDVPNMDWLFASHERYMDFTHEVGFTKESLRQVMSNVFSEVDVTPVESSMFSYLGMVKKAFARFILNKLLSWAEPQGASAPIWARSLIGVGKK